MFYDSLIVSEGMGVTGSSDEDDELDDSVGLGAVYAENLDELSDEGDYEVGEEEEEDEDGIEEEEDEVADDEGHIQESMLLFYS